LISKLTDAQNWAERLMAPLGTSPICGLLAQGLVLTLPPKIKLTSNARMASTGRQVACDQAHPGIRSQQATAELFAFALNCHAHQPTKRNVANRPLAHSHDEKRASSCYSKETDAQGQSVVYCQKAGIKAVHTHWRTDGSRLARWLSVTQMFSLVAQRRPRLGSLAVK
jgi:hypothetical protein